MSAELRELLSKEDIGKRVAELGREISDVYGSEPVVAVCVLKGAFIFFADLLRAVSISPEVDFVRLASYGASTQTSGQVRMTKDLDADIAGKHVLIVEDIVDTGLSIDYLKRYLELRNPTSLKVCALIDKGERREFDLQLDFVGFRLTKGFVVGYGLDFAEKYRELPAVYEVVQ
jgi:hypoxanthine phosphoribosyltransferase